MSLIDDFVACRNCAHIADEHRSGFFRACDVCGCEDFEADPEDRARIIAEENADITSRRLTLTEAEAIVGEPAEQWVARCFEIASALAPSVGGVAVYGHYTGFVARDSHFDRTHSLTGWTQHGWVKLPDESVFDPTRWVFEGDPAYLYEGPADDYDEGGNRLRLANLRPFPATDGDRFTTVTFRDLDTAAVVGALTATPVTSTSLTLTPVQWHWVATLPWECLGDKQGPVYSALDAAGLRGLIPLDNRLRAEREAA